MCMHVHIYIDTYTTYTLYIYIYIYIYICIYIYMFHEVISHQLICLNVREINQFTVTSSFYYQQHI